MPGRITTPNNFFVTLRHRHFVIRLSLRRCKLPAFRRVKFFLFDKDVPMFVDAISQISI
jgi:hypothetical protein